MKLFRYNVDRSPCSLHQELLQLVFTTAHFVTDDPCKFSHLFPFPPPGVYFYCRRILCCHRSNSAELVGRASQHNQRGMQKDLQRLH